MDHNKDEAERARNIAEKKFSDKDLNGAKKFALKAQKLCPALHGIDQFVVILDVYISAQQKIDGEVDWYRVLGVDPSSDEDTIRKNYRRLALTVHPDKNKSVGADGAFKLISEAWSLLSDESKRVAYDKKRTSRSVNHNKVGNWKQSWPTGQDGLHSNSSYRAVRSKPNTFWTVCSACKAHAQYPIDYLNRSLYCKNCHQPFFAVETSTHQINDNVAKSNTFRIFVTRICSRGSSLWRCALSSSRFARLSKPEIRRFPSSWRKERRPRRV